MKREQQNKLPYTSPQCDTVKIENIDFLCVSTSPDKGDSTTPSGYQNKGEHSVGSITFGNSPAPAKQGMLFEEDTEF
ncbi:MAG: hypothetical protein ACFNVK_10695 [Prevotella sp.]